jgi:subtilisin family serine protease
MESQRSTLRVGKRQRPSNFQLIGLGIGIAMLLLLALSSARGIAANGEGSGVARSYIVVLKDSVNSPGAVAEAQTEQRNGDLSVVYRHALNGYAAQLPSDEIEALRSDPRVAYVTPDHKVSLLEEEVELETEENGEIEILEATIPTGISRIFAASNKALDIDGKDDLRANVDVAVIDTGLDYEHPDLDVAGRTSCITGTCIDNTGKDGHSHGTHVAGTIGAIDNGEGVVGVAPGARMWGVKVLNDGGSGFESWVIAGVDWVTAHAKDIEVANMSLGCLCSMPGLDKAINSSIEAGVVYAVAAGNSNANVNSFSPASNTNVITVSALADYDGLAGEKSSFTCQNYGLDDRKASFSNYGTGVDIAAPGVCILSTLPGNKYGLKSGTSMASPHVAGAAAILASQSNPNSKKDAETIRETLIKTGNKGWTDTSGDGVQEPLLDVSNETTFRLSTYAAAVLADAPVSYWRLGETSGTNAGDEKGTNPGTYQSSPTLGATSLLATDAGNTAVSFDGTNDNVKVPSSASLQFTSSLSLEAWIKPTSLPTSGKFASILTKAESYSLQFNGPRLEFTIMQSGVRQRLQAAEGAITAGQTYHVVGTYDGTTQRLYINGNLVASTALSGSATTNTNVLYIGSWNSAEEFFKGTIDEPAVYGSVLSPSRIAAHYEAGT